MIRFAEGNWSLPRLGKGSTDGPAGTLVSLFDFSRSRRAGRRLLDSASGEAREAEG